MFEVCVEDMFSAGHALRNYHGETEPVHGHNFRVQLGVHGADVDENGLLFDFVELKNRLRAASEYLDHRFINDLKPFDEINPSAENIARFICDQVQRELKGVAVSFVKVWETDTAWVIYRPKNDAFF